MKKITTIMLAVIYTANIMAQVPNYVPTNGLVGWWPFNGNANDESGNGNNGTVNGATLTTDRFGNVNKAYNFNGVSNFIKVNNSSNLNNSSFSISGWFNPTQLATDENTGVKGIIGKWWQSPSICNSNYNSFLVCLTKPVGTNNTYLGSATDLYAGDVFYSSNVINTNNWYHFIFIHNANNGGSLYVNGNLVNSNSISGSICNSINDIYVGADVNSGSLYRYFNGKIDDLSIWNRALTQQEITDLYNGCKKEVINISPIFNNISLSNTANFSATTITSNPSYIWQSDLGQGFQTLNNIGKYSGTATNTMSISNAQLSNHMEPIRAISVSGNCRDTSNIAYVKITDTCITKITKYDTIKVTDTLVINATLSGVSAPNNSNRLIVYPNPAKDHITIDYGVFSRMNGYTLKIVNTLGQVVFSSLINQQSSYINLSTWTGKGMYNVQIFDPQNNLIENRKIVLQ